MNWAVEIVDLTKVYKSTHTQQGAYWAGMWWNTLLDQLKARKQKGVIALDRFNLRVREGDFVGIIGPNGAGKTTLMKILACILRPTSGTATVNGYDVLREREKARASSALTGSSDWLVLDWELSARENLEFWARLYGAPPSMSEEQITHALKLVGLIDRQGSTPGTFSSGMRQKMCLALGLLMDAPIYLLDEPTASLDPPSAHNIREFLKETVNKEWGKTVIIATHNMWEIEEICNTVVFLDKGKVVTSDTPEGLKERFARRSIFRLEVRDLEEGVFREIERMNCIIERHEDTMKMTTVLKIGGREGSRIIADIIGRIDDTKLVSLTQELPSLDEVFASLSKVSTEG